MSSISIGCHRLIDCVVAEPNGRIWDSYCYVIITIPDTAI